MTRPTPRAFASSSPRALALAWTVATGFCGLVDEVVWQRALSVLLGSHAEATAAVLALFLGGLAAGYAGFGRLCHRHPEWTRGDLLRRYAAAEAGIGLHALAFPWLFAAVRDGSAALPAGGFAAETALCALLVVPPAFLMGATVPLLTDALARDADDATRLHAQVYGWNTLGAFLGALGAGFFLLPALGVVGSLRVTAAVNFAAALGFLHLARQVGEAPRVASAQEPDRPASGPSLPWEATAAAGFGFALMTLQTVAVRVSGLAFGASPATFAIVVATFVLCIALGSLAVARFAAVRSLPAAPVALGAALLLAALFPFVDDAAFVAHRVRVLLPNDTTGFHLFQAATAGLVFAALCLPLALSGSLLPLMFDDLRQRHRELGAAAGRLYAWNTVGSVLGALVGGYALLRFLDLHAVYRVGVGAVAIASALLAHRSPQARPIALGAASLALVLAFLPAWTPEKLSTAHLRQRHGVGTVFETPADLAAYQHAGGILFATDDPTTTVLVNEHTTDDDRSSRALFTNGKSDGSLWPDYPTMALAGLIPCALADRCENAFVIGLGTGVTAGELAALDGVERVAVAEISTGVVEALPLFAEGNLGLGDRPAFELRRSDAYRSLLREPGRFDVIASEPSHPWAIGVENLFALEFLRAARDRLAPGGVFAQWIHAYEMDDATLALVLRTYAAAFPEVAVWYASGPDLLLLGFGDVPPARDPERLAARFARPDFAAGFARAGVDSLSGLLAHELVPGGVITRAALPGPIHTLLHPRLAHAAAAAFFRDDRARLPRLDGPDARARALHARALGLAMRDGKLSEDQYEAVVRRLCVSREWECTTALGSWRHDYPDSPRPHAVRAELAESQEPHLLESRIDLLAGLFGDGLGPLDAESTRRVHEHYTAYYHHALPFRPEAIARTLERCEGEGCEALRTAVRKEEPHE